VYGVGDILSFLPLKPQGEHAFVLCTGTACYVKGANEIQKAVEHHCECLKWAESEGLQTEVFGIIVRVRSCWLGIVRLDGLLLLFLTVS